MKPFSILLLASLVLTSFSGDENKGANRVYQVGSAKVIAWTPNSVKENYPEIAFVIQKISKDKAVNSVGLSKTELLDLKSAIEKAIEEEKIGRE